MEIDEYYLAAIVAAAAGIGFVLAMLWDWYRNRSPEILTRGQLKKYKLPTNDGDISHIFCKKPVKRIEQAKTRIVGLEKHQYDDDEKIKKAMKMMNKIRLKLNLEQENIREMETEGEVIVFMKTHLTPHLSNLRLQGERLGAALGSKTAIAHQLLFLEQVVQGHERKKVFGILDGTPFKEIDEQMLLDNALEATRKALDLESGDAKKTAQMWLERKSDR